MGFTRGAGGPGEHARYMLAEHKWCILAEHAWYIFGEHQWCTLGEHRWYIYVRLLTLRNPVRRSRSRRSSKWPIDDILDRSSHLARPGQNPTAHCRRCSASDISGSGGGVGDCPADHNLGGRHSFDSLIRSSVLELFTSRMISCPERLRKTMIIFGTYSTYLKITFCVPLN
jgi:hypothetical protein